MLWLKDMLPGAGLGVIDHAGQPKVALRLLRRALAPIAVWTSDEGVAGRRRARRQRSPGAARGNAPRRPLPRLGDPGGRRHVELSVGTAHDRRRQRRADPRTVRRSGLGVSIRAADRRRDRRDARESPSRSPRRSGSPPGCPGTESRRPGWGSRGRPNRPPTAARRLTVRSGGSPTGCAYGRPAWQRRRRVLGRARPRTDRAVTAGSDGRGSPGRR